jgi:hypothetical protein
MELEVCDAVCADHCIHLYIDVKVSDAGEALSGGKGNATRKLSLPSVLWLLNSGHYVSLIPNCVSSDHKGR